MATKLHLEHCLRQERFLGPPFVQCRSLICSLQRLSHILLVPSLHCRTALGLTLNFGRCAALCALEGRGLLATGGLFTDGADRVLLKPMASLFLSPPSHRVLGRRVLFLFRFLTSFLGLFSCVLSLTPVSISRESEIFGRRGLPLGILLATFGTSDLSPFPRFRFSLQLTSLITTFGLGSFGTRLLAPRVFSFQRKSLDWREVLD